VVAPGDEELARVAGALRHENGEGRQHWQI
jgi:hypothetical protein